MYGKLTVAAGSVAVRIAVFQFFEAFLDNVVQTKFVCSTRSTDHTQLT